MTVSTMLHNLLMSAGKGGVCQRFANFLWESPHVQVLLFLGCTK